MQNIKISKLLIPILILLVLCNLSCIFKGKLTDKERDLIRDVEKFNRDYGSKGVTIKNLKIGWEEEFVCNGLILKNSIIKNVELQRVELKNTYIEDSIIENVSIVEDSDLSDSTFKNVKFKNFKSINKDKPSDFEGSVFIDCEFINCEYSDVYLGKEYRNCKFNKVKEIKKVSYYNTVVTNSIFTDCELNSSYTDAKFENVTFNNCVVRSGFSLDYGKNIQFINCVPDFGITARNGKIENVLVQSSRPERLPKGDLDEVDLPEMGFTGNMKNIVIRDCPVIIGLVLSKGTFDNISIINCKYPATKFYKVKLSNLLIKDSIVQHLKFDESDVSGDNRIMNNKILGNFYGKSKVKNLTITDCEFKNYVDIVYSELIRLKLNNNIYKSQFEHGNYQGEVKHNVKDEKFIDSDKFPLEATPFPEHIERYYENMKKTGK